MISLNTTQPIILFGGDKKNSNVLFGVPKNSNYCDSGCAKGDGKMIYKGIMVPLLITYNKTMIP